MSAVRITVSLFAVGLAAALGCSGDYALFTSSSSGGSTVTSSSGSTSSSGTGGSSSSSGTTASSGTGGTGGSSSSGTGGTGGMSTSSGTGGSVTGCAHDPCELGEALDPSCDSCVDQICQSDGFCCNNDWDYWCVNHVQSVCSQDCGAGLIDCNSQYGGNPGYLYACTESPATCDFGFNEQAISCAQYCSMHGGECIDVYNNDDNQQCGYAEHLSCDHTGFQSVICICSRGCGVQPPCNAPAQHCVDGSCQ